VKPAGLSALSLGDEASAPTGLDAVSPLPVTTGASLVGWVGEASTLS
jgi:hypothetical protein